MSYRAFIDNLPSTALLTVAPRSRLSSHSSQFRFVTKPQFRPVFIHTYSSDAALCSLQLLRVARLVPHAALYFHRIFPMMFCRVKCLAFRVMYFHFISFSATSIYPCIHSLVDDVATCTVFSCIFALQFRLSRVTCVAASLVRFS